MMQGQGTGPDPKIRQRQPEPKPVETGLPKLEVDFDAGDRTTNFVTVPDGDYLCRIAEVRAGTTRGGDERWSFRLVVADGLHIGKQAAWDSLVFSGRGLPRARSVFSAFGMPSSGKVQVSPSDLEGRTAIVTVRATEYSSQSGDSVRRNEVPYDGYKKVPPAGS